MFILYKKETSVSHNSAILLFFIKSSIYEEIPSKKRFAQN